MHYAYLASQQDSNLQKTYDSMVDIIKDEKYMDTMIDQYLLHSSTPEQAIQNIKSLVVQNKEVIDDEM